MGYEVALDYPGEVRWFKSDPEEQHRRPAGPCPHAECQHFGQSVVAWGPDLDHYELVVCDDTHPGGCDGWCRGWLAVGDNQHGGYHDRQPIRFTLMDRPASLKLQE